MFGWVEIELHHLLISEPDWYQCSAIRFGRFSFEEWTPSSRHLNYVWKFSFYFVLCYVCGVKNRFVIFRETKIVCCGNCRKHINEDYGTKYPSLLLLGLFWITCHVCCECGYNYDGKCGRYFFVRQSDLKIGVLFEAC